MTEDSFSADWLALREPADHAARDAGLAARLGEWMRVTGARHVLDLGCGSGSTLRALTPHLPDGCVWTLLDYDARLLAAARARLIDWADAAAEDGPALALIKGAKRISVRLERRALSAEGLADLLEETEAQVVTASAFFDLAGMNFIDVFAAAARKAGLAVYAALTYDGRESWAPADPAEAAALAAFHAHMRADKGLGPATGPESADILENAFKREGFEATRAPSPWRLSTPREAALIGELARGSAAAVAEVEPDAPWLESWTRVRMTASRVEIGHADILALPPA